MCWSAMALLLAVLGLSFDGYALAACCIDDREECPGDACVTSATCGELINRKACPGTCAKIATPCVDDTGTIPSSKAALKCEDGIAKAVGKAVSCVLTCHIKRADGKLADDTAEDACEKNNAGKSCLEKFIATATKLQTEAAGACNCVNVNSLASVIETDLDSNNNSIYCAGNTPWGADDTGFIPPDKATEKCEDGLDKLVGKAVACVIGCHIKRADGKLADDTAEDACEKDNAGKSCLEKFTTSVGKLKGCPACVNSPVIANMIESVLDADNSLTYCASPSGAFIDLIR